MARWKRERARRRAAEDTKTRLVILGLNGARVGLGISMWAAPAAGMRLLGLDPDAQSRALARLVGTRDLTLGLLALGSLGEPRAMRATSLANAWVDAGDAAAFGIALVRREGIDQAGLIGTPSAAAASAIGFWLADRLR